MIRARYLPDGALASSVSAPVAVTVYDPTQGIAPQQTFTILSVPRRPKAGEPVTMSANVGGARSRVSGGFVEFYVDGVAVGRAALVNGTASLTLNTLSRGSHGVIAIYLGSGEFGASRSREAVTLVP